MIRTEYIAPLHVLLAGHARLRPSKVAFADRHRSVTYADLDRRTNRIAGSLAAGGIVAGDRVAIVLPNSVDWIESCLGIVRCGGVAVPISAEATPAEMLHRLSDSGCAGIIIDERRTEAVECLSENLPALRLTVVAGMGGEHACRHSLSRMAENTAAPAALDPEAIDAVSFIVYTSGTTGRAKGVMLTLQSMLWVVAACWAPIAELNDTDYVVSPLPLYHSYALNLSVLGIVATGATEFIMEKYSTTGLLDLLRHSPVTVLPGVPTMFHYLLQAIREDGVVLPPSLRLLLSAGAVMPGSLNRGIEEQFGVPLLDGYGITETSTMVTLNWPQGTRIMGSCGLPLPGLAVRIVDPVSGHDVAPDEEGELIVRGPNMMRGYFGKPQETEIAIRAGWYRTGDLAKADSNGFLSITGRLKELIIRGGQNIAPSEIEEVASSHYTVLDCAAVGIEHAELGQVPVLFVVPRPDQAVDTAALLSHIKSQLSTYKVPHAVYVVDSIPRTGSGKVMRHELRKSSQGEGEKAS